MFEISPAELAFASREGIRYDIYRVFLPPEAWRWPARTAVDLGGRGSVKVTVVKDVARALQERRVQLCMAV